MERIEQNLPDVHEKALCEIETEYFLDVLPELTRKYTP